VISLQLITQPYRPRAEHTRLPCALDEMQTAWQSSGSRAILTPVCSGLGVPYDRLCRTGPRLGGCAVAAGRPGGTQQPGAHSPPCGAAPCKKVLLHFPPACLCATPPLLPAVSLLLVAAFFRSCAAAVSVSEVWFRNFLKEVVTIAMRPPAHFLISPPKIASPFLNIASPFPNITIQCRERWRASLLDVELKPTTAWGFHG